MKLYTIVNVSTGSYPYLSVSSNDGADFCGDYSARLSFYKNSTETPWVTNKESTAIEVLNGVEWYNSSIETPSMPRDFDIDNYSVIEIGEIIL